MGTAQPDCGSHAILCADCPWEDGGAVVGEGIGETKKTTPGRRQHQQHPYHRHHETSRTSLHPLRLCFASFFRVCSFWRSAFGVFFPFTDLINSLALVGIRGGIDRLFQCANPLLKFEDGTNETQKPLHCTRGTDPPFRCGQKHIIKSIDSPSGAATSNKSIRIRRTRDTHRLGYLHALSIRGVAFQWFDCARPYPRALRAVSPTMSSRAYVVMSAGTFCTTPLAANVPEV